MGFSCGFPIIFGVCAQRQSNGKAFKADEHVVKSFQGEGLGLHFGRLHVIGLGLWVWALGFRVSGLGFRAVLECIGILLENTAQIAVD